MPADVMEEEISPHMQFTHSFARVFNVFNEGFRSMLFHIVIVFALGVDFFFFFFFSFFGFVRAFCISFIKLHFKMEVCPSLL